MLRIPLLLAAVFAAFAASGAPPQYTDLAVDRQERLIVLDAGGRRILRIDENRAVEALPLPPGGLIERPGRVVVGPDGLLYVSDSNRHRVVSVNFEDGVFRGIAGTGRPGLDRDGSAHLLPLSSPAGLAVGPDGRLWIADTGNRAVRAVSLEERRIETVAGGWNATQLVMDEGRFQAEGRFIPVDVDFDATGQPLLLDRLRRTVWSIRADGALAPQDEAGTIRVQDRQSFAVGPNGVLWFVESAQSRVRAFTAGAWTTTIQLEARDGVAAWPTAVVTLRNGELWILDSAHGELLQFVDGASEPSARMELGRAAPPARGVKDFETVEHDPDPAVVLDPDVRRRIVETDLPWRLRHLETGIEFTLIPPGEYLRGAASAEEDVREDARPRHRVRLSRPYYLATCELTNSQLQSWAPQHSALLSPHHDLSEGLEGLEMNRPNQPATNLSWFDAQEFCERWGFRLPTEAEWEYAARAGVETRYPWGDDRAKGLGYANLANPSVEARIEIECHASDFEDGYILAAPVGSFRPNRFGLYDMTGNAWEWCADWHAPDEYARCADGVVDPTGPAEGEQRILRGGSWQHPFNGSAMLSFRALTRPSAHFVLSRGVRPVWDPNP